MLSVLFRTADNVIFEGMAESLSSFNDKGEFSVLPSHCNFISMIHTKVTIFLENYEKKEFPFEFAVLKIQDNEVKIFGY